MYGTKNHNLLVMFLSHKIFLPLWDGLRGNSPKNVKVHNIASVYVHSHIFLGRMAESESFFTRIWNQMLP